MGNIFNEMARMQEEMDKMFGRFFSERTLLPAKTRTKHLAETFRTPVSEVYETESSVIANIELPGAEKKDIELNVTDRRIEVKVEKKVEKEHKAEGAYSHTVTSKSFYRNLQLPAEVTPNKAKASFKNGILRIEIPKAKKEKHTKVNIE